MMKIFNTLKESLPVKCNRFINYYLLGIEGLIDSLITTVEKGVIPIDLKERDEHFGSNFKEPMKRTPFCKLFFGALEDFMLRILLVCAVISITIDMAFADAKERSHGILFQFNIIILILSL